MGEEVKELLVQFVDRPLHPRTTMVSPISSQQQLRLSYSHWIIICFIDSTNNNAAATGSINNIEVPFSVFCPLMMIIMIQFLSSGDCFTCFKHRVISSRVTLLNQTLLARMICRICWTGVFLSGNIWCKSQDTNQSVFTNELMTMHIERWCCNKKLESEPQTNISF